MPKTYDHDGMTGVENVFIYWTRRYNFWTGEPLSAKLSTGEATWAHLTGALGPGVLMS